MAEAKTIDYYLANPDEMPEDLSQLAMSLEPVAEEPKAEVPQDAKQGDSSDAKEPEQKDAVKAEEKEPEPTPVLKSKNGKDEIPYHVLTNERERRAAAEKAAEELRQKLAEIEAQVKAGQPTQTSEPEKKDETVLDDDALEQLSNDFPTIGKVIAKLQAEVNAAKEKLREVEEVEQQRAATESVKTKSVVQEAIDATPALLYWQSEDDAMFAEAIQFDNILRADPRNSSLTLVERFEKVVKAMEAVHGPVQLPDTYKKSEPPRQDMNELTEKAKAVVKEAGSFKPKSLSDIPGGTPPASSESEKFETMSPAQLAAMMSGMDSDQINAMLAKLG